LMMIPIEFVASVVHLLPLGSITTISVFETATRSWDRGGRGSGGSSRGCRRRSWHRAVVHRDVIDGNVGAPTVSGGGPRCDAGLIRVASTKAEGCGLQPPVCLPPILGPDGGPACVVGLDFECSDIVTPHVVPYIHSVVLLGVSVQKRPFHGSAWTGAFDVHIPLSSMTRVRARVTGAGPALMTPPIEFVAAILHLEPLALGATILVARITVLKAAAASRRRRCRTGSRRSWWVSWSCSWSRSWSGSSCLRVALLVSIGHAISIVQASACGP
jgi:hypothetical protein